MERPNYKGYRNERAKQGKKYKKKTVSRTIETAGDFSVIVDPHLWKQLQNDDNDETEINSNNDEIVKKLPLDHNDKRKTEIYD